MTYEEAVAGFEKIGEEAVRANLAAGRYGDPRHKWAQSWLDATAEAKRAAAYAEQAQQGRRTADATEEQATAAKDANRLAREANTLSKWAIGIATVAAVAALTSAIFSSN